MADTTPLRDLHGRFEALHRGNKARREHHHKHARDVYAQAPPDGAPGESLRGNRNSTPPAGGQ